MEGSVWSGLLTSVMPDGDVWVLGVSGVLDAGSANVIEQGLFEAALSSLPGVMVVVDLLDCRASEPEYLSRALERIEARSTSGTPIVLVADPESELGRLLETSRPHHGPGVFSCLADAVHSHPKNLRAD